MLVLHLAVLALALTCCTGQQSCHQSFIDHGCICESGNIMCESPGTDFSEFPISAQQYPSITSITIKNAAFRTLNRSHLEAYPMLRRLHIENGLLSEVTNDALSAVPFLGVLHLSGNRLVEFPNVAGLQRLTVLQLHFNQIRNVSYDKVKRCRFLSVVDLRKNDITILRNGTFMDSCFLSFLNVSYNPLHTIESHFFDGLAIRDLDLSYTDIDHFPHAGLRYDLKFLNLEGCKRLKHFPSVTTTVDDNLCTNLTFPFLRKVIFEYHSLCCRYRSIKPYTYGGHNPSRCPKSNVKKRSMSYDKSTCKQEVSSNFICLNLTSGNTITGHTPSKGEIFDITELCGSISFCFDNRCPQNCNDNAQSNESLSQLTGLACVKNVPTIIVLHTSVCWSNGTILTSPPSSTTAATVSPTSVMLSSTSTTVSPSPSPTSPPTFDCSTCDDIEPCLDCIFDDCASDGCEIYQQCCDEGKRKRRKRDIAASVTCTFINETVTPTTTTLCNSETPVPSCSTATLVPSISISLTCSETFSMNQSISLTSVLPMTSSLQMPSPSSTTPTPVAPMPDCDSDLCLDCVFDECEPVETCGQCQYCCDNEKRKKRDVQPSGDPDCSVTLITIYSTEPFAVCSPTLSSTSVPSTMSSASSQTVTTTTVDPAINTIVASPAPFCTPPPPLHGSFLEEMDQFVECSPANDPFNPCDNIIDSTLLRTAIWLVIFLSIGGNALVISVTSLYSGLQYIRNRKKPQVIYFMYLNLAIADLFMGMYLLTIAAADLDTIGEYSEHAIDWQTGPGCQFAGFCAIFSSILSVYTLLVITVERVYTIKFAIQHKKFRREYVGVLIVIGWILTIILCILPLFNVNDYGRVSICLPFETRNTTDLVYIASLLTLTGLASIAILLCYCFLFYMVACNSSKRSAYGSMSMQEELKLALRMSLLIFTDFACWTPIAFFGLTAAFKLPLIGVHEAKILMVFIFPINSCLNPILYSFSTRRFRNILCSLLNKCGLCTQCNKALKHQRSSSGIGGNHSSSRKISEDIGEGYARYNMRRGTQLSLLSHFVSLSSVRGGSQSGSRRGSALSGSSDEGITLQHIQYHSNPTLRHEQHSETSLCSRSSQGSYEGPPSYVKDRRVSLASLSGLTMQLTALPEEKEEDVHSVKKYSGSDLSDNSSEGIKLQYTVASSDDVENEKKTEKIVPLRPGYQSSQEEEDGGLPTADMSIRIPVEYSTAFTEEFEDLTPPQYPSQDPVIETTVNELDGTESQRQQITF